MKTIGFNSIEKRAVFSLSIVFALRMLGLFMVLPVISVLSQEFDHFSASMAGLAVGAYGITQAIFQIPLGMLSDRIGRKPVICLGLVIFALGSLVCAFTDNIYVLIAGRAIQGAGAVSAALLAFAGDLARDSQKPKVMAFIGMGIGLTFMLSLIIGPLLADFGGLSGMFTTTFVLALSGIAIIIWVAPQQPELIQANTSFTRQLASVLTNKNLLQLDFGIFTLHMIMTANFVVVPLVLKGLHLNVGVHWKVYLPVLLSSFFLMWPLMVISMRKQKQKLGILAAIGMIACAQFLLASFSDDLYAIVLMLVLYFVGFNFLEATYPALISKISPTASKGTAMGVYSTLQFFGAFAGGVLGGVLFQHFGANILFTVLGILSVLWLLVCFKMVPPDNIDVFTMETDELLDISITETIHKLTQSEGVLDCHLDQNIGKVYLKVDRQKFTLNNIDQDLPLTLA